MKSITMDEALSLIQKANTLSCDDILKLQKERLQDLVAHARKDSVFYREKYADLPENPTLDMLPAVTKQELTARMQNWICDPDFSEGELTEFIGNLGVLGGLFMDKYSVSTTSGTTGEPLRMLRDARHVNINTAILQNRLYQSPLLKNFPAVMNKTTKLACVLATGGHHAAFTSFEKRRKALAGEGIVDTMELLSIGEPVGEMVRRLNEFQPEVVTGYPSFLRVLSGEQHQKRLNIAPQAILCSAEQLTDETRKIIEKRFSCPVGNVFCSTEGGEVAILCDHGHMHLNSDWVIVEPIDKDGNPIPPGVMSDAMLVTNLANAVQPIIRYRVDDCVVMHDEPCECGLPFPYVDVLGRTDDMPEFESENGVIHLSSIVFLNAVVDIPGIAICQFFQPSLTSLILRIQYLGNVSSDVVDRKVRQSVEEQLANHGLKNIVFEIRDQEPQRAQRGQKMQAYVKASMKS